jgi:hypothetical protein
MRSTRLSRSRDIVSSGGAWPGACRGATSRRCFGPARGSCSGRGSRQARHDLGEVMVHRGLARDCPRFSQGRYAEAERHAAAWGRHDRQELYQHCDTLTHPGCELRLCGVPRCMVMQRGQLWAQRGTDPRRHSRRGAAPPDAAGERWPGGLPAARPRQCSRRHEPRARRASGRHGDPPDAPRSTIDGWRRTVVSPLRLRRQLYPPRTHTSRWLENPGFLRLSGRRVAPCRAQRSGSRGSAGSGRSDHQRSGSEVTSAS